MASAGIPDVMNETAFLHCTPNQHGTVTMLIVMITEMIVGLPGNIVAMWIFCFRMKFWKPHTLYLFNLVLADFLLLISVPFRIDTHLNGDNWVFGEAWCRINLFMLSVNRSASIAFMTVVALDRYFKVVRPHHRISRMTLAQAGKIAGLIWILVIALRIPLLTINLLHQHGNLTLCRSFSSYREIPWAINVHYVTYIAEFFLPWFLLLFCSAQVMSYLCQQQMKRQKRVRKAIMAVGVISLVFTICFLPAVITGLGGIYIKKFYPEDCTTYTYITQLFMVSITFTYANSALDPVIYSFSSSMFHDALRRSMRHLSFAKKRNVRSTSSAANNSPKVTE